jgi:hypothetical protein
VTSAVPTRRGLWNDSTVAWYQRANQRSDYAATVLQAAADVLQGCRTALDVGAGFGALALPLARRMDRVTALEPAPAMAHALRGEVARQGLDNVTVIEAAWGEAPLEPHDLVLCAHVGPLLGPGSAFLRDVSGLARRAVVLVRDAGEAGDDKFFFTELYPLLLGRRYEGGGGAAETLAALEAVGVRPAVTPIVYHSDQPFDSLEEACDFWMTYMGLTSAADRAYLRSFLEARLVRSAGGWIAPLTKHAAVIRWRVGPQPPRGPRPASP